MTLFLAELKRRGVLKIATAYLVVCWLILEIGDTLFLIFELPHAGMQMVFVLLALGFPLALGGAWHYRFAESEQSEEDSHGGGQPGQQLAIVFAAVAVVVIGVVIVMRFVGYEDRDAEVSSAAPEQHTPSAPAVPPEAAAQDRFAPPERSVAVMSFANMSGDANEEYFSDGLSEELLNSLARIDSLQVAARTSSFSFKGTAADIPTIGRKLNVAAVLEGSVRKSGQRVRITAQLIDAVNGYHLWSDTFDRELTDIFALQTDIAAAVTQALKLELLADQRALLRAGGTENSQAYDAYLRGLSLMKQRLDEASDRASLAAMEEAVRLDPSFALAHAARAVAMTALADDWIGDAIEAEAMLAAAVRASIAPSSLRRA